MVADRLLVLHAGALGDLILTLHLLGRIRAAQSCRVTLTARSSAALWAAARGYVDEAYTLDSLGFSSLYAHPPSCSPALCDVLSRTDRVLGLLGDDREPAQAALREHGRHIQCIDPRVTARTIAEGTHIVDQWTRQLTDLGWSVASRTSNAEGTWVSSCCDQPGGEEPTSCAGRRRRIIIHPGSGGTAKCCPLEAMEVLIDRLTVRGNDVRWMIGPDEMERFGPVLVDRLRARAHVICSMTLEEAVGAIESVDVYIGMDAGMTHVAALLGCATVAIFGPTDPRVWRPLGRRVRVETFPAQGEDLRAWAGRIAELE